MKRFLFGFLAVLFLILNTIPYLHIMADQSMTDAQIKQVGAFALSSLITSGEATELDFSDYTDSDTDFLLGIGELIMTGDPSGLIDCGLDWLGGEIDDAYDSAIQSIREWEYNMSPTLYYWFVDTQPPYELSPTYNNIHDLTQPLRRLLTPPNDSQPTPTPSPDPDFSFISNVNKLYVESTDLIQNGDNLTYYDILGNQMVKYFDFSNVTLYGSPMNSYHNDSGYSSSPYFSVVNGIITVYLTTNQDETVSAQYQPLFNSFVSANNLFDRGSLNYYQTMIHYDNWDNIWSAYFSQGNNILNFQTEFAGISTAINYLNNYFCNINLYVDHILWVSTSNISSDYPIIIPDQLTIWNDQPLQYEFPSDTYLKLPDLTNIITNAINNSGIVMWSDIADCFVDVNGQTAVAVTKIVRNDYDNLYMEQYPYPAMLPGMTEQTKFNEHLLDNSHAYLSPMGTVVQETVNVLPSELVGVLAIGAILTIFAVIINRLLE